MNKKEIEKIAKSGAADDKKKLIELLDSDSPGIVELVQNALINTVSGKKEMIKKLMDYAASPLFSIKLRSNSFDTLKQLALRSGNFLTDYVGKNKGKYDRLAAELMRYGRFTPPDFPKGALKILADSRDEITRANAVESIGILKIDLGNILIKALSGNFFVLSAAVFSIGELKLKKAFPKLKEILLNTDDRVIKNIITESLSKIGGDDVTDFLLDILNKNAKYKLDKIYILKSLYKICLASDCDRDGKNNNIRQNLYLKLSKMNLKISIFSLNDYEEKDAVDAILCYFSLLNHKKSRKIFQFIFEYYQKNENLDETEYGYIKEIVKKIARPKFITEFIKSLKPSADLNNKTDLLVDALSDISPKDIINLLDFYKGKKLFVEIKLSLLKYAQKLSGRPSYEPILIDAVINGYIKDVNGDVRKSAAGLLGYFKNAVLHEEKIFNGLLKENYPDVIDAYVEAMSNLISINKSKKYIYFFMDALSLKNDKAVEYSLRILGNKKIGWTEKEIADLYAKFSAFKYIRSVFLKRLLAKSLKNFDLIKHKEETAFMLKEDDEETRFNYLESLLLSKEKNYVIFLDALNSGEYSDIFRYKIIELIQKTGSRKGFDELLPVLRKEKSKMVKIALLRALHSLDKEKSNSILKKYNSSKDKDIRNFSLELTKN
jgi:HEAT repeat protein